MIGKAERLGGDGSLLSVAFAHAFVRTTVLSDFCG